MPYASLIERRRVSREWATKNRALNPEKVKAAIQKWRKKSGAKIRAYKKKRFQEPEYKLLERYRTRIWWALKREQKSAHTQELLGCSIEDLKTHLELLFKPGMTWENYGPVWHVDHKRPCAAFDLSVPAQQKECFNFRNLQPLFAEENLKKGSRVC